MYERVFKRCIDCSAAAGTLLILLPLMLVIALAIAIEDGGPSLFRQRRVGRNREEFTLLKFRSMPVRTPDVPSSAAGGLMVTKVGRLIRRSNLDELPQLVNVLKGEMSLIGPRPALPTQEKLLELRRDAGVSRVRPGLTGLAQVKAYDGMPETEKVAWEAKYVARITFVGDVRIILSTLVYLSRPPPVY
jgi:O-antigen biosynthesis protein WbqP